MFQSPPLAGLPFATAHTLVTFFVCRLELPRVGGAYRFAVGGKVFNRGPAGPQIALAILGRRKGEPPNPSAEQMTQDNSRRRLVVECAEAWPPLGGEGCRWGRSPCAWRLKGSHGYPPREVSAESVQRRHARGSK
jgi:hypothetical protein